MLRKIGISGAELAKRLLGLTIEKPGIELAKRLLGVTLLAGFCTYVLGRETGVQSSVEVLLLVRLFIELFFSGVAILGAAGVLAAVLSLTKRLRSGGDLAGADARDEVLSLAIASCELLASVLVLVLGGFVTSSLIAAM